MKNRRKAVQPFEIKKRKIDIFRNYEANGFEKNQRKFENFSTLISKKSTLEEQSEILRWSENYSSSPTEAEIKEANSLLVDFLEQYCELTEGIMSLCPDCEYISIMGP